MYCIQNFLTQAGHDSVTGGACGNGTCLVNFNGQKTVASVVLIANGISFAIMTLLFTTIGSSLLSLPDSYPPVRYRLLRRLFPLESLDSDCLHG